MSLLSSFLHSWQAKAMRCSSAVLLFSMLFREPPIQAQPAAFASGSNSLTLRAFVQKVLRQNESLQVHLLELEISNRKLQAERGAFEPELVGSAERVENKRENTAEQIRSLGTRRFEEENNIYNGGLESLVPSGGRVRLGYTLRDLNNNLQGLPSLSGSLTNEYQTFFGFSLVQPLLKGFGPAATLAGIRLAAVSSEIAFQEYRRQLMVVISTAEATYWSLFLAQEQVRFFNDSVALAETILRDNRSRALAGKASELEVLEAEAGLALRKSKQSEALQKLYEALNRVTTLSSEAVTGANLLQAVDRPEDQDTPLSYPESARIAFDLNPDYLIQRKKVLLENIRLAYAKNQRWPQLDLKASYGLNGLAETPAGSWEDVQHRGFPSWSVGGELRIPLTGGIKARNDLEAAKLRQTQVLVSLKEIETQIVNSLDTAMHKIQAARESIRSYNTVVTFNQNLLESQLARLQVGKVESRKVLEVEADLFEAKNAQADALVQLQRAILETDLIRGSILKGRNLDLTQKELEVKTASLLTNARITDSQYERLLKEQADEAQAKTPSPPGPVPPTPESSAGNQAAPMAGTDLQPTPPPPAAAPATQITQPVLPATVPEVGPVSKTGRLLELLNAYKLNQLTPAEYHQQRAKVLAEP